LQKLLDKFLQIQCSTARDRKLKGLRAFREEFTTRRSVLVSMDSKARRTQDGIDILPWRIFIDKLYRGEL